MSNYTTLLKNYIESFTDYKNAKDNSIDVYTKIETGRPHLFDFSFPWYSTDETTLIAFETDFIIHYYFCEIGFETVGLFKMRLNDILRRNMVKYQKIFNSDYELKTLLQNHDMTYSEVQDSNVNAISNSTDNSQEINSNNPQINFSGTDYASEMNRREFDGNTRGSTNSTITNDRTEKGYSGNKFDDLIKYREHIININNAIIEDCEELFMGIFSTGEIRENDFNMAGFGNPTNVGQSIDWGR